MNFSVNFDEICCVIPKIMELSCSTYFFFTLFPYHSHHFFYQYGTSRNIDRFVNKYVATVAITGIDTVMWWVSNRSNVIIVTPNIDRKHEISHKTALDAIFFHLQCEKYRSFFFLKTFTMRPFLHYGLTYNYVGNGLVCMHGIKPYISIYCLCRGKYGNIAFDPLLYSAISFIAGHKV